MENLSNSPPLASPLTRDRIKAGGWPMLDKVPVGAYTCDHEGLITYFNASSVQIWGREPKLNDPLDRFCGSFRLFHSDGAPMRHEDCWMAKALSDNVGFNGCEVIIERASGERIPALAHANPLYGADTCLVGAVNVLVDITERKKMDELQRVDRSKNEFLATLAHELRNPLAPIHNAVEMLQSGVISPNQSAWALGTIQRQTRQMSRLIDDLLDLARITNNKLELRVFRVDLAEVVEAAVEISQPLIEERDHRLRVEMPSGLNVNDDSMRLAQVFSNLVNNAAKFTPPGGTIGIRGGREAGWVQVAVRDSGSGIAPDLLPRIFDMFTQEKARPLAPGGGLGIGLSLSQRLVMMHGGALSVSSAGKDQGSEFSVALPCAGGAAAAVLAAAVPMSALPKSNQRVGIVDDQKDAAVSLGMLLELTGREVRTAFNAAEALAMVEEFHPDVLVLDIGLPDMSGDDVAREIRSRPGGREITLIAATGWGQESDRRESQLAGIDHHLVKPIEFSKLLDVLKESHGFSLNY